jgi:hypothetical protein
VSDRLDIVSLEWRRVLANELNNNLLMNTAKGKTAFACGAAFALHYLEEHSDDFSRDWLRHWLKAFVKDYMTATTPQEATP